MATRNIIKKGDPTLKKKARPVTDFDDRLHILLDDMRETLAKAGGVGLAAPQVGILRRAVIVVDADELVGGDHAGVPAAAAKHCEHGREHRDMRPPEPHKLSELRAEIFLERSQQALHHALRVLVRERALRILDDEAQGVLLLAGRDLVPAVDVE